MEWSSYLSGATAVNIEIIKPTISEALILRYTGLFSRMGIKKGTKTIDMATDIHIAG